VVTTAAGASHGLLANMIGKPVRAKLAAPPGLAFALKLLLKENGYCGYINTPAKFELRSKSLTVMVPRTLPLKHKGLSRGMKWGDCS
jgi:hypothetical protein